MVTRNNLEIAFFKHPSLWLFIPEQLFKEQAKIAISRYNYYIILPKEYNKMTLEMLLLNQGKGQSTFNKWAHNYVNLINKLHIKNFTFPKILTINDQRKIWLEFFCFIMRLELKINDFITSEISYDLFSREYSLQEIIDNLSKYIQEYPFINTIIQSLFKALEKEQQNNENTNYRVMYILYKKSFLMLGNYIMHRKLSLQKCVVIIQFMLHFTWISGYATLNSYENIQHYIRNNLIYKKDRINDFLSYHDNFISVITDDKDNMYYNHWFGQKNLIDAYNEAMLVPSLWDDFIPIKILWFFYAHKRYISYKYLSENNLTENQRKIQILEKEAMSYDINEDKLAQEIFHKKLDDSAIEEIIKSYKFKYEINPHNLIKLIKYRTKLLNENELIMEKKHDRILALSINLFLIQIKGFLLNHGLELSLNTLFKNDITYDTNSLFWEKLCKENRPKKIIRNIGILYTPDESDNRPITYEEELQLYDLYKNVISYETKFTKEKVYKIYLRTFDIGLKEELKLFHTFEEKIYALICFSYRKLYEDRYYFKMEYNDILQFIYYKIFKLCEDHFNVINNDYFNITTNDKAFMGEQYLSEIKSLFENRLEELKKVFFYDILSLQLYKRPFFAEIKNNSLRLLTHDKKEMDRELLISAIYEKKLITVVKALKKYFEEIETSYHDNKSTAILTILFYMVNIQFGYKGLGYFPLDTKANILLLLGEILYYDDNILHQILDKKQHEGELPLRYDWLNNKACCTALKPVIQDMENIANSYQQNITKENAEITISSIAFKIFRKISEYCDVVGADLVGICFIKVLLFDLEQIIFAQGIILKRFDIIRPPLREAPEKIIINISRIVRYIFSLEQNVGKSHNLMDFYYYYPNKAEEIIHIYENHAINPYKIISCEREMKDILSSLKNEYYALSFDTKILYYEKCDIIQKKYHTSNKALFSLNYKLILYLENNNSIFADNALSYKYHPFSGSMNKLIYNTLNFTNKIKKSLHIGYAKNSSLAFFSNDIVKELLIYIISPEDINMVIILGVISADEGLLKYYAYKNIKNNGIYFPIDKLRHAKPTHKHYRAIFLRNFLIMDKENLFNITIPSDVFSSLLYTDSEKSMTFIEKFLINWRNYALTKNVFTYDNNDRVHTNTNLDVLKNYAIRMYENFLSNLPQIVSYYAHYNFINNYSKWRNILDKQCIYILRLHQEALKDYNNGKKTLIYNHPVLTVMQELSLLILFIINKETYNQHLYITGLKNRHVDAFKKEFLNHARQYPYFNVNDILLKLKNCYDKYNDQLEDIEQIMQYIYRLEQEIKDINTPVENITKVVNSNEKFIVPVEEPSIVIRNVSLNKMNNRFKIISWNINSIVAREKFFLEFIKKEDPDIILLQELRCTPDNFPKEIIGLLKYNIALNCYKGYNGVAILSKYPFKEISFNLPGKVITQARYLEAIININDKDLHIGSIYAPHGKSIGHKKYRYKLKFYDALRKRFKQLNPSKNFLIFGGDYNIDPDKFLKRLCCTNEEQERFSKLLELGLITPFKEKKDVLDQPNNSLQLDHFLVSANKAKKTSVRKYYISKKEMLQTGHAPISCKVRINNIPVTESRKIIYIVNENNSSISRKIVGKNFWIDFIDKIFPNNS